MALSSRSPLYFISSSTYSSPYLNLTPRFSLKYLYDLPSSTLAHLRIQCTTKDSRSTSINNPKAGVSVYKPKSFDVLLTDAANSLYFALQDGKLRLEIDFP